MKKQFYLSIQAVDSLIIIVLSLLIIFTTTCITSGSDPDSTDTSATGDKIEMEEPPPREPIVKDKNKYIGMVYSATQMHRFEEYWNQVSSSNTGKWGMRERKRDEFNWTDLDSAYGFAKEHGFQFRHHVLVWGNQQPVWINMLPPEEQLEEIKEWFSAVAERYPEIDVLEVVNEPLHDPPDKDDSGGGNYMNALGGKSDLYGTGWDWVIKSFEMAKEYFPDSTRLVINDYNIVNNVPNTQTYVEIIKLLLDRGLIDGIGVQGQAFSTRISMEIVKSNLDLLAETGLPIIVTEMNIDGGKETDKFTPTEEDQLFEYMRIFPTFWEHPAVQGITLSGWRWGMGNKNAILMNRNGSERLAMKWLIDYIEETAD